MTYFGDSSVPKFRAWWRSMSRASFTARKERIESASPAVATDGKIMHMVQRMTAMIFFLILKVRSPKLGSQVSK
jgi:hypothetical protein